MDLRECYRRFRAWQLNPFDYTNHSEHLVRCANCGTEFSDNFCPRCGQKAGVGPVGWNTVRQSVTLIWGMDNRSLGYSLLQLVLRPGYMISDYLSGKRQVSFPPVKMLLLVAVAMMISEYFFDTPTVETSADKQMNLAMDKFDTWAENNLGWAMLVVSSFFLLPTWLHFRYSPKHYHHTLPEGFFIQVFMSSLMAMISIICMIIGNFWVAILIPCYYTVAYRQLFNYSWWGTLWRIACCFLEGMFMIILAGYVGNIFLNAPRERLSTVIVVIGCVIFLALIGFLIDRRHRRRNTKELKQQINTT